MQLFGNYRSIPLVFSDGEFNVVLEEHQTSLPRALAELVVQSSAPLCPLNPVFLSRAPGSVLRARILDLHPVGVAPRLVDVLRLLAFLVWLAGVIGRGRGSIIETRLYICDLY